MFTNRINGTSKNFNNTQHKRRVYKQGTFFKCLTVVKSNNFIIVSGLLNGVRVKNELGS